MYSKATPERNGGKLGIWNWEETDQLTRWMMGTTEDFPTINQNSSALLQL